GNVMLGDFNLSDLDVYFWHDLVHMKVWGGDNYNINILRALEAKCALVNSSESTRIVNDKFLSHLTLANKNLPVADFALIRISDQKAAISCFEKFNGEILLKPRFRGFGMGILKISAKEQLIETLELLQSFLPNGQEQVLVEKFYPNNLEKWVSVVVFNNKVLFGYRKKLSSKSDWKIYDPARKDAKGQFTEYVKPTKSLSTISLRAAKAIGKDIICFDFIYTDEGYKIIDENGRPGFYHHCLEVAGVDLKKEITELILSKIKEKFDE
ncbi:MAG: ATP-grasp domain-containing protein, partial [Promethearchaeota archaeon]